jgi:anaerobic C4-dicarboxylate transporter
VFCILRLKWMQASMTALSAGAVGEGLKLLVLLHSMVEGEEAQLDVMHVLLPVIIAAASVNVRDNQVNLHVYCIDPNLDRK